MYNWKLLFSKRELYVENFGANEKKKGSSEKTVAAQPTTLLWKIKRNKWKFKCARGGSGAKSGLTRACAQPRVVMNALISESRVAYIYIRTSPRYRAEVQTRERTAHNLCISSARAWGRERDGSKRAKICVYTYSAWAAICTGPL